MITRNKMSAEEFEAVCEQLGPCELVHGEIQAMSPGGYRHSRITIIVAYLLESWARDSGRGTVLGGEAGFMVQSDPDTVRGADVAYISFKRLPEGQEPIGFVKSPPELVVEIVGEGQGWREMVEKAGEYLRMGVDRVWVIDPDSRRVHVFRPDAAPIALNDDETIQDEAILPGFHCLVSAFFGKRSGGESSR